MRKNNSGFSFIEMAIALVIIGLLIVGVLAGQSLIHSSKIRSVVNQLNQSLSSIHLFQQKYGGLPGDIADITTQLSTTTTVYNGNSDGQMVWNQGASNCTDNAGGTINCSEGAQAWRQLGLAGMVDGSFTGTVTANLATPGTNIPTSSFNAGIGINYSTFNHFQFATATAASINSSAALSPNDTQDIDRKSDDGLPNTGIMRSTGLANCANGVGEADTYKLDEGSTIRCAFTFRIDAMN